MLIFDGATNGPGFRHMCQGGKNDAKCGREKYIIIVVTHDYEFLNQLVRGILE